MSRGVTGRVYLVGAGPGDPRLLTVRAHELVRAADVLAHDELVSPEILALAPRDAERIAVGRRAGHGPTTFRLHPAILERALAGRNVVRLKCGDPMVFGRGGEEAEELAEHGIPFEVVPGVSAALGAAAYAGITLTHRDCASSVRFVTGHCADEACEPCSDTGPVAGEPRGNTGRSTGHVAGMGRGENTGQSASPFGGRGRGETVVIYMASRRVAECLAELARAGWPRSTPVAWIAAATTPRQRVIVGTIGALEVPTMSAPALLIVGDVVARRTPWLQAQDAIPQRVAEVVRC